MFKKKPDIFSVVFLVVFFNNHGLRKKLKDFPKIRFSVLTIRFHFKEIHKKLSGSAQLTFSHLVIAMFEVFSSWDQNFMHRVIYPLAN